MSKQLNNLVAKYNAAARLLKGDTIDLCSDPDCEIRFAPAVASRWGVGNHEVRMCILCVAKHRLQYPGVEHWECDQPVDLTVDALREAIDEFEQSMK